MRQTILTGFGAIAGVIIWLALRSSASVPDLFVCVVSGAFAGVGLHGLAFGQLSLAGRGGKSPKLFQGASARLIGCLVIALSAGLAALVQRAVHNRDHRGQGPAQPGAA